MNKLSLVLKTTVLLSGAWLGMTFAPSAQAQTVIGCMVQGSSLGAIFTVSMMNRGCASEYTVSNQFTYLSTGRNQSVGGAIGGAAGLNDGVIELLRKLNDNAAKGVEGDRQNMPNDDLASRHRETDLEQRRAIERYTRPITADACREGTVGSGLGGGGGGSGSGGAGSHTEISGDNLTEHFEEDVLQPKNENSYLGDLAFSNSAKRYCSAADVNNKMPGCTSAGELPAANTDPTVLLRGAAAPGNPRNYSIDFRNGDKQYDALLDYVRMARPFPGPTVAVNAKDSPTAKQFLVYQRRYNSRVLAVINGFTRVAADSAKLPADHPFVKNVWNAASAESGDLKKDFTEVYGANRPVPDRPSERELLRLMVLRQYTTELSAADMQGSQTPEYYGRRQLEVAKLNAYLLMKLNEQQEWNNILLSHILSNDIDPVTRSELVQKANNASAARPTQ